MADLLVVVFLLVLALVAGLFSAPWGIFFATIAIIYLAIRWNSQRGLEQERWTNFRHRLESLESDLKHLRAMRAAAPAEAKPESKPAEAAPAKAPAVAPAPVAAPIAPPPAAPTPLARPPEPSKPAVVEKPAEAAKPAAPSPPLTAKPPVAAKPVQPAPSPAPPPSAAARPFQPPVVAAPPPMAPPPMAAVASARVSSPVAGPVAATAPRKAGLEEVVGTNWLPKLGVALIVGGLVSLLIYKWSDLSAVAKLGVGFLAGGGMLGGGVLLEKREHYRLFARSCIGGGWAMIFLTTFAMYHIPVTRVLDSPIADLLLMIAVATAMVVHTLRYRSQLATGFAFLLGYVSIFVNSVGPEGLNIGVSSLVASVVLSLGLVMVVVTHGWYELEVLAIVATYLNHYYWLRPIIEPMGEVRRPFPEFATSAVVLCLYWAVFRASYLLRRIESREQENVSTIACLLNSFFLLGVMRYQSVHPELAFWFLLALGAVEMTLGVLPSTRKRRAAFVMLVTLGATLMVAAMPFRYADHPSRWAVLWLVEAQALFLAGVFSKEIVFRRLGLVTAALAALRVLASQQYHAVSDTHQAVVFGLASALFFADALLVPRWKPELFDTGSERTSLRALTYVAAVMAFAGTWVALPDAWVAVGWAAVAVLVAIGGDLTESFDLGLQAHGLAAAAFIRLLAVNLDLPQQPGGMNLRLITMAAVAVALYLCGGWSGIYDEAGRRASRALHNTAASFLFALLVFYECKNIWIPAAWLGLALVWALVGRRFKLGELSFHAVAMAIVALFGAWYWDFGLETLWQGMPQRTLLLLLLCAGYFLLASYSEVPWLSEDNRRRLPRELHDTVGCYLLATVAWYQSYDAWIIVSWAALFLAYAAIGRRFKLPEFGFCGHVLAAVAIVRALYVNLTLEAAWYHLSQRLVTVVLFTAALYLMAEWSEVPGWPRSRSLRHVYTWASLVLVMGLLWYELQPIAIALGWMLFGLVLFEIGVARASGSLRLQGYVVLGSAFVRMFFANLNAEPLPAALTVVPLAVAFFYVYGRIADSPDPMFEGERLRRIAPLFAYMGTATVAALLRFQIESHAVILAWAVLVIGLTATAWRLGRRIFLHQALLLTLVLVFRALLLNLQESSQAAHFHEVAWAAALLFASLFFAFRLREPAAPAGERTLADAFHFVHRRPEQLLFFAPLLLFTAFLALELQSSLVTVAWGLEGVAVFVAALWLGERTYRLAGLGLLMVCVGKILVLDVWRLQLPYRFVTFTVLGVALLLVSSLYIRYKEAFRKIL